MLFIIFFAQATTRDLGLRLEASSLQILEVDISVGPKSKGFENPKALRALAKGFEIFEKSVPFAKALDM
jgi:hypothetical protein